VRDTPTPHCAGTEKYFGRGPCHHDEFEVHFALRCSLLQLIATCPGTPVHLNILGMKRRSSDDKEMAEEAGHSSRKRPRSQRLDAQGRP
jgi:hypothetical protein